MHPFNYIQIFFRGHGTYVDGDKLIASVAGVVERVNKLICVRPFKTRYNVTCAVRSTFSILQCTCNCLVKFSVCSFY